MSQAFTVEAEPREDFGKNAARRTRAAGRIPGVVYGGGGPVIPVSVDPVGIRNILHSESGHNTIFTLEVRGKAPARAMVRDWQSEPIRGGLLHVDLVRIALDTKLRLKVAIHVTGEPKGVKVDGGGFEFMLREHESEREVIEPTHVASLLRLYGNDDRIRGHPASGWLVEYRKCHGAERRDPGRCRRARRLRHRPKRRPAGAGRKRRGAAHDQ